MDVWPKVCPASNKVCQNYRANIRGYEAQLDQIKKHGRKLKKYKKYSGKELKTLLTSLDFVNILNEMVALSTNRLKLKFTPKCIKSITKVPSKFITKYAQSPLDSDGPMYRLRCKCVVVGKSKNVASDTAQNIVNSLEILQWKLNDNIAAALSDVDHPYRGGFDVMGHQVHSGQSPTLVGQHFIRLS